MDLEQRSGNGDGSKISGTHPEVLDGNDNKKHSETLLEVTDANRSSMLSEDVADTNESSSYFELKPGFAGGSESGNQFQINPETYPEVVGRSRSSKKSGQHLELTSSDHSRKNSRTVPNASISEGHEPIPAKKLVSSSSSSSSSVSSTDDLFQVDVNNINNSISRKANEDMRPTPIVDQNEGCSAYNPKSEAVDNVSHGLTSTSQTSGITSKQLANAMSPTTQSPPIQTMDRSGGYDPLRIPSSIFESSKPSTPMDWSAASNESLFSLHMGNSSFREQVLMYGDLTKSGELTKSVELFMLSPPPANAVAEVSASVPGNDEPLKDATKSNEEDIREQKAQAPVVSWNSTNSNHSTESGISRNSFTFPVKKKCAWRSCYCSNCSWTFCYCSQPRRCFRWPSCCNCSNCKWPSCCYCSKFKWPSCCNCSNCKWPSCCYCSKCKWPSCHCCNCSWPCSCCSSCS